VLLDLPSFICPHDRDCNFWRSAYQVGFWHQVEGMPAGWDSSYCPSSRLAEVGNASSKSTTTSVQTSAIGHKTCCLALPLAAPLYIHTFGVNDDDCVDSISVRKGRAHQVVVAKNIRFSGNN